MTGVKVFERASLALPQALTVAAVHPVNGDAGPAPEDAGLVACQGPSPGRQSSRRGITTGCRDRKIRVDPQVPPGHDAAAVGAVGIERWMPKPT